jgi:hypothetical protein
MQPDELADAHDRDAECRQQHDQQQPGQHGQPLVALGAAGQQTSQSTRTMRRAAAPAVGGAGAGVTRRTGADLALHGV